MPVDGAALSWPEVKKIKSSLRTQEEVDGLSCMSELLTGFIARPAGNLRVCSPPPPGGVCVYPHVLEAGFCCTKTPPRLQALFCEVLSHFSLAPSQLWASGWGNIAHFYKLCGSAGVPPSLALFRHFFLVCKSRKRGRYVLRISSLLPAQARMPTPKDNSGRDYFFLSSPAPWTWTCPVHWGEPSEESKIHPALEDDETVAAYKALLAFVVGASVDTCTAMIAWVKPDLRNDSDGDIDSDTDDGNDTDCDERRPLSGRKRNLEEANMPPLQAVENAVKLVAQELCKAKETAMQEKQKTVLLQAEVKKLRDELSVAKEAAKAEGEKAAALQVELEKLKVAKAKQAAHHEEELEKLKVFTLRELTAFAALKVTALKTKLKKLEKLRAFDAVKVTTLKTRLKKLEKLRAAEAKKAATLQTELNKMKVAKARNAEPLKVSEEFDIYLS